ncbi:MAG: hypothetical protein RMK30_00720 [Anaerolineae bacterium]|nr:hypothetical protein [Anaerolineae bacterium]MDW8101393.1 hypothetical protein [Anaerolineae bacterium]
MKGRYYWLIGVLLLQVISLFLYPPKMLREISIIVLPLSLFVLFLLALLGLNTGVLNPLAGRNLLVFVQGLNIVMRLLMFMPGARSSGSSGWNVPFIVLSIIAIALSWASIIIMERRPPRYLLFRLH